MIPQLILDDIEHDYDYEKGGFLLFSIHKNGIRMVAMETVSP